MDNIVATRKPYIQTYIHRARIHFKHTCVHIHTYIHTYIHDIFSKYTSLHNAYIHTFIQDIFSIHTSLDNIYIHTYMHTYSAYGHLQRLQVDRHEMHEESGVRLQQQGLEGLAHSQ